MILQAVCGKISAQQFQGGKKIRPKVFRKIKEEIITYCISREDMI
jgi:hypothetical protein